MNIEGVNVPEQVDGQTQPIIRVVNAAIDTMRVGNPPWRRPGLPISTQPFLPVGGSTIDALLLTGLDVEGCTNLLRHLNGTLPEARAVANSYRDGGGSAIATTGTITNLAAAGNVGLTTPGTVTNKGENL